MSPRCVALVFALVWIQTAFIKGICGQAACQTLDLAFLIDQSGSICDSDPGFDYNRDNTCSNWNFIIQFIYQICNSLVINTFNTRVAVATFATQAILRWNLTAYTDKSSLLNAINTSLPYSKGGQTNTTGGLLLLNTQIFNTVDDRPNDNNTCIIITDGKPTDSSTVPAAIQAVHNSGIRTLVVGVTDQVDTATLKLLSSSPQEENVTYFWARDFKTIDQVRVLLTTQTCFPPTQAPPSPMSPTSPLSTAPMTSMFQTLSDIGCNVMDICYLIDRSGSICDNDPKFDYTRDNTCDNWNSIITFLHGITANMNIGPSNVRVAVVIFSSSSLVAWGLNNYTDKASLLSAIDNLQYLKGGTTDTTGGLNLVNTQVFNSAFDRTGASKTVIIVTDGKPTDPSTVPAAIQAVHASNIRSLCVGITNSIDEDTIKMLSSPPQKAGMTYFMATNYSTINLVQQNLQDQTCGVGSTTAAGPFACTDVQDVVIVLDGSGSICDSDPNFDFRRDMTCDNWKSILAFIHNIVNSFPIGPSATRVALVLFSTNARLVWGLDTYTNKDELLYAIDNLQYAKGGTTNTTGALNVVNDQVFTPQLIRPNVAKVAIIITDGKPTVPSTVPAAISAVQANGIRTLAVGVTNQIDNQTLILLASPPKTFGVTIFMASDYRTIDEVRQQLLSQACPGTSTLTSSTTTTVSTTMSTTTMGPTTSPSTPGTTTMVCTAVLDLCFVVDGSGSICDTDPMFNYATDETCGNWRLILQFIHSIVQSLVVGLTQIRVGMVVFASEASVLWNLDNYTTSATLLSAIDSIQYHKGGRTDTTGGLNIMRTRVFGTAADRPNANNTAIIITDGKPTDTSTVQAAIDAVHSAGIKTFVVGVTNAVDEGTLKQLSSPPQQINVTYFTATGFDTLATVQNVLQTKTCGSS